MIEESSSDRAPLHSGLRQATYTCVPLSPNSILGTHQSAVPLGGWEGNLGRVWRRTGLMSQTLWFIHLGSRAYVRKMSTPPTPTCGYGPPLPLITIENSLEIGRYYFPSVWTENSLRLHVIFRPHGRKRRKRMLFSVRDGK